MEKKEEKLGTKEKIINSKLLTNDSEWEKQREKTKEIQQVR